MYKNILLKFEIHLKLLGQTSCHTMIYRLFLIRSSVTIILTKPSPKHVGLQWSCCYWLGMIGPFEDKSPWQMTWIFSMIHDTVPRCLHKQSRLPMIMLIEVMVQKNAQILRYWQNGWDFAYDIFMHHLEKNKINKFYSGTSTDNKSASIEQLGTKQP